MASIMAVSHTAIYGPLTWTFNGREFETHSRHGRAPLLHAHPTPPILHVPPSEHCQCHHAPRRTGPLACSTTVPPLPLRVSLVPCHRPLASVHNHTPRCTLTLHRWTLPPCTTLHPDPLLPWPRAPPLRLGPRAPLHAPPCPRAPRSSSPTPASHVPPPPAPPH